MGYPFYKLKKLWLLYLFLLFFTFFMFVISINVYIQSMQVSDMRKQFAKSQRHTKKIRVATTPKNVIAHYIGSGDIFGNMSKDDYNINLFQPIEGEGADGRPVVIPPRESFKMQRYFKINNYNILASDRIALNRTLKDYRIKECQELTYPRGLPTTSVIIVFHNEAWSVLLRTIWSVINRSPSAQLKEIILVDDASDRTYLGEPLDVYITSLKIKTHIFRLNERSGIVKARLLGASHATGDILTFLDAHCECSRGWLEPLLARIKESRTSVVCPVIDIISDDNFSYTKTFENYWGAFSWQLNFRWFSQVRSGEHKRSTNLTLPIETPAMAGGLFSIDRKYFYEIGTYDDKMKIWGGENIEMSLRIWQCGGRVEISPCSHIGHIFRKNTPYTFPGGISRVLGNNIGRTAAVWMDEWKSFFFMYSSLNMDNMSKIDVSERIALRKRLQCKSFAWYLENIWPEHFFPAYDRFFGKIIWLNGETPCSKAYSSLIRTIPGRLMPRKPLQISDFINKNAANLSSLLNRNSDKCIRPSHLKPRAVFKPAAVDGCNTAENLQDLFILTPNGEIRSNENICLDYIQPMKWKGIQVLYNKITNVQLTTCSGDAGRQHWKYDLMTQNIIHQQTKMCLTMKKTTLPASVDPKTKILYVVEVTDCSIYNDTKQKWGLIPVPWKK